MDSGSRGSGSGASGSGGSASRVSGSGGLYLPRASQTTHEHMADFVLIQLDQKSVLVNNSYSLDCPLGYKLDGYNCPLGYAPDCQS